MKLTREEALKYHRQMWGDMQKELGDKAVGETTHLVDTLTGLDGGVIMTRLNLTG